MQKGPVKETLARDFCSSINFVFYPFRFPSHQAFQMLEVITKNEEVLQQL
jgi:hypothetical protein